MDARVAYPEVLHVEVRDAKGGLWRLATQAASWTPEDPGALVGRTVEHALIRVPTEELLVALTGQLVLKVTPPPLEELDEQPNWELHSPDGRVLEFGPGIRWQIGLATQQEPRSPSTRLVGSWQS